MGRSAQNLACGACSRQQGSHAYAPSSFPPPLHTYRVGTWMKEEEGERLVTAGASVHILQGPAPGG